MEEFESMVGRVALEFSVQDLLRNLCGEDTSGQAASSTPVQEFIRRDAEALLHEWLGKKRLKLHSLLRFG